MTTSSHSKRSHRSAKPKAAHHAKVPKVHKPPRPKKPATHQAKVKTLHAGNLRKASRRF